MVTAPLAVLPVNSTCTGPGGGLERLSVQVAGVAPLGNIPPQFTRELMELPLLVPVLTSTQNRSNKVAVPMRAPGGEDGEIAENNSSELFVDFDVISLTAFELVCAASVPVCAFRWPKGNESNIERVRLNNTNIFVNMATSVQICHNGDFLSKKT